MTALAKYKDFLERERNKSEVKEMGVAVSEARNYYYRLKCLGIHVGLFIKMMTNIDNDNDC